MLLCLLAGVAAARLSVAQPRLQEDALDIRRMSAASENTQTFTGSATIEPGAITVVP